MAEALSQPIFSDEIITATDLNRQSGAILSRAAQHPVTIVRNDECFTRMRREDIAGIVAEAAQAKKIFEILNAAFLLSHGQTVEASHPYSWLRAFDEEEIQELVAEVSMAYRSAGATVDGWDNLDAIIHEWNESAIAILSEELAEAWQAPTDEVPLTLPNEHCAS